MKREHKILIAVLLYTLVLSTAVALLVGAVTGWVRIEEPCNYEDCIRLKDLPAAEPCVTMGDAACLVVPD